MRRRAAAVSAVGLAAMLVAGCSESPGVYGAFQTDTGDAGTTTGTSVDGSQDESSSSGADSTSGTSAVVDDSSSGVASDSSTSTGAGEDSTTGPEVDTDPPTVVSTAPADLDAAVSVSLPITVTFSEPMDAATVTTNVGMAGCTGALQVSADDFATCVPMAAAPSTGDDVVFTVSPTGGLSAVTTYRIRVTDQATDLAGNPLVAYAHASGFTTRYGHTIVIDGTNDFDATEALASSTPGHTAYAAWDDDYLYLGLDSPDVASGHPDVWVWAYLGVMALGTGTGVTYNTQTPMLPFPARWHVRWKADHTFTGALEFSMAAWNDAALTINPGDVFASGTFVELRIAWVDLGSPTMLDLSMGLLRETAFDEATWAGVPAGAYIDGYDPDIAQYYSMDLDGSVVPADHPALP